MTRVAVREVIEAGTWALRAAGVEPGDAPLAAQAAAMAEIAGGTGVTGLCDSLSRLAGDEGPGLPSVDGAVVSCPVDVGGLLRMPRVAMAVSHSTGVSSLTITNTTWHDSVVGALIENYRTTSHALLAIGHSEDGSPVGWSAVAATGIWLSDEERPDQAAPHHDGPGITVMTADSESFGSPSMSWDEFDARHLAACRGGLFPDDETWRTLVTASYRFLIPDNE